MSKPPTKGQSSDPTLPVNDDGALEEAVVARVERLIGTEPERLRLWRRVASHRDWLNAMVSQWMRLGRWDLADEICDAREKLDAEIQNEPALKKLRSIVDGHRVAIEKAADDAVLTWLHDRANDDARRVAESMLGQLRGWPVDIEEQRAKVLAAIAREEGNTSKARTNVRRRIVRGDY